jgi:Fe-S oxidoreductase
VEVFRRANLKLAVEASGCCGMSGAYGHEARNQETSRTIFNQSWQKKTGGGAGAGPLATGDSCRSQVKRLSDRALRDPLEVLLELYRNDWFGA